MLLNQVLQNWLYTTNCISAAQLRMHLVREGARLRARSLPVTLSFAKEVREHCTLARDGN